MPKQLYIPLPDGREWRLHCTCPGCRARGVRGVHAAAACASTRGRMTRPPLALASWRCPLASLPAPAIHAAARLDMVQRQLGPGGPIKAQLSEGDLQKIVARTEGYSGCAPLRALRPLPAPAEPAEPAIEWFGVWRSGTRAAWSSPCRPRPLCPIPPPPAAHVRHQEAPPAAKRCVLIHRTCRLVLPSLSRTPPPPPCRGAGRT